MKLLILSSVNLTQQSLKIPNQITKKVLGTRIILSLFKSPKKNQQLSLITRFHYGSDLVFLTQLILTGKSLENNGQVLQVLLKKKVPVIVYWVNEHQLFGLFRKINYILNINFFYLSFSNDIGYHFTTYDQKSSNYNYNKNMILEDKEDFDGNWNWIYFGYSINQEKVFAYTHFSRS